MTHHDDIVGCIGLLAQLISDADKLLERANAPTVEWTEEMKRWRSHLMVRQSREMPNVDLWKHRKPA